MEEDIAGMLHKRFSPPSESTAYSKYSNSNGYRDGRRGGGSNKKGSIVMNLRPATGHTVRDPRDVGPSHGKYPHERRNARSSNERIQLCSVCDGEIRWNYSESPSVTEWKAKVKKFYSRQFLIAEFLDESPDCNFPFCFACAKQLENLMSMERKYETIMTEFQHGKEVIATMLAKAYLRRVESDSLFHDKDSKTQSERAANAAGREPLNLNPNSQDSDSPVLIQYRNQ